MVTDHLMVIHSVDRSQIYGPNETLSVVDDRCTLKP